MQGSVENNFGKIYVEGDWTHCIPNPKTTSFAYVGSDTNIDLRLPPKPFQVYNKRTFFETNDSIRDEKNAQTLANSLDSELIVGSRYEILKKGHYNKLMFLHLMLKGEGEIGKDSSENLVGLANKYILDSKNIKLVDINLLAKWALEDKSTLSSEYALQIPKDTPEFDFKKGIKGTYGHFSFQEESKKTINNLHPPIYDYLIIKSKSS